MPGFQATWALGVPLCLNCIACNYMCVTSVPGHATLESHSTPADNCSNDIRLLTTKNSTAAKRRMIYEDVSGWLLWNATDYSSPNSIVRASSLLSLRVTVSLRSDYRWLEEQRSAWPYSTPPLGELKSATPPSAISDAPVT